MTIPLHFTYVRLSAPLPVYDVTVDFDDYDGREDRGAQRQQQQQQQQRDRRRAPSRRRGGGDEPDLSSILRDGVNPANWGAPVEGLEDKAAR